MVNPFTKELLNYSIQPGQVANVPQGWWHYEIASVDNTHLLAIFDAPVPEFIGGSDLLRLTPASVFARSFCLNEAKVKDALAPITKTVVIGPPSNCKPDQVQPKTANAAYSIQGYHNQAYGQLYRQGFDYRQQQPFIGNGWGYSYYNNGY